MRGNGNSYLVTQSDLNVVSRGVRCVFKLAHSEPMRSALQLNHDNHNKNNYFWFGDRDPEAPTNDDILEFVRRTAHIAFHAVRFSSPKHFLCQAC